MLRNPGEPPHSYTLYVEYLGGLVPLLKGRRTSKIRPEFVIFDPESGHSNAQNGHDSASTYSGGAYGLVVSDRLASCSDDSDNDRDMVELCGGSPRFRRKNRRKCRTSYERSANCSSNDDEEIYADTLPENARLVEVTSNIWGTKFKFHGLADSVPANLGRVTYRPSLLHLQPRQMTLVITELRDDLPAGPDPSFNPNLFSEDEEDNASAEATPLRGSSHRMPYELAQKQPPPIAPMTPRTSRRNASSARGTKAPAPQPPPMTTLPHPSSDHEDDYSYEYHQVLAPNYCEAVRATAGGPPPAYHRPTYAPRCCDVPALQSPKNAVAPTQTLIATSSPTATLSEFASNVQRMKTALADQQSAISSLVKKDIELNSTSKIAYTHGLAEDKYTLGGGGGGLIRGATCRPQSYAYTNGHAEAGPTFRNNRHTSEEEEQCNDVPALKNQFQFQSVQNRQPTVVSIGPTQVSANSIVRSCSVGYLDLVDAQIVPCDVALSMLRRDAPNKRLFLISRKNKRRRRAEKDNNEPEKDSSEIVVHRTSRPRLSDCGKSRSLDSSELFPSAERMLNGFYPERLPEHEEEAASTSAEPEDDADSEIAQNELNARKESLDAMMQESRRALEALETSTRIVQQQQLMLNAALAHRGAAPYEPSCLSPIKGSSASTSIASSLERITSRLDGLTMKLGDYEDCHSLPPPSPRPTPRLPRSSPSSPAPSKKGKRPSSSSPIRRRLLSSPLLSRKSRKNRNESSDEEGLVDQNDLSDYRDLETFQKAQFRQKLRQRGTSFGYESEASRREIIMHNKAPMWNEANQVYQLDFGGRVTQESAKNFQIEFRGNQVMQFGRIQGNAYTLDFQYPFSAIQAFAVALASVTQRLK